MQNSLNRIGLDDSLVVNSELDDEYEQSDAQDVLEMNEEDDERVKVFSEKILSVEEEGEMVDGLMASDG